MIDKKEKETAYNTSAGTDERQPQQKFVNNIIANSAESVNTKPLDTISMTELYDTVYPSKKPLIEGMLYSGLYMFVGAPKTGKSFAMEQIGYHISKGFDLWGRKVIQGKVLYLALEDDYRRLQGRLYKMYDDEVSDNFFFAVKSDMLSKGLEYQLTDFIKKHKDTSLIIIDTLQKVREFNNDNFSYAKDYDVISSLKKIADDNNICIVLVHHTRKQESSDAFDGISGTNGLFGAADGAFVLHKDKRIEKNAILDISGRDIQEQRLHLHKNEKCIWELVEEEVDTFEEPTDEVIMQAVAFINQNDGFWSGTATEFANSMNIEMQPNQWTRKLNCNANILESKYCIKYSNKRKKEGTFIFFEKLD